MPGKDTNAPREQRTWEYGDDPVRSLERRVLALETKQIGVTDLPLTDLSRKLDQIEGGTGSSVLDPQSVGEEAIADRAVTSRKARLDTYSVRGVNPETTMTITPADTWTDITGLTFTVTPTVDSWLTVEGAVMLQGPDANWRRQQARIVVSPTPLTEPAVLYETNVWTHNAGPLYVTAALPPQHFRLAAGTPYIVKMQAYAAALACTAWIGHHYTFIGGSLWAR